jgi:RHS repeat-associated protein
LVGEIAFGDAAGTTTTLKYDGRRRLASAMTSRGTPGQWSMAPPDYSPAPTPDTAAPTTFQLLLQDLDYSYDVVGNPTEIRDWRVAEDWPAGAKPVSRRFEYDDLNRVTRVDYSYPGGTDRWTSPYAAELAGVTDPRRVAPLPHQAPATRPQWHTYRYDWLGNVTQSDDDRHIYFDRSLGNISHLTTTDPKTSRPYQLAGSTSIVVNTWHGTTATVSYTPTGELKEMRAQRQEDHCVGGGCYTRFNYDWDEVGRLLQARRISAGESIIMWMSYDANDQRVHKYWESELNPSLAPNTTVYIFDNLEARHTTYDTANQRYVVNSTSEVAYLSANGMRLARLHYEPTTKGEPKLVTTNALHASNLHVMLSLPDHLGSSSLTIDHATGELVEARTYQPYGATESDYRPERWKGFRDDYGFTGKEEDAGFGLQYFGKRYLSPYLGRWISADPLAVHQPGEADLNLYAYVRGAVLKSIDPVGLEPAGTMQESDFGIPPPVDESGNSIAPKGEVEIGEITVITGADARKYDPKPAQTSGDAGEAVLGLLGTQAKGAAKGVVGTGAAASAAVMCPLCAAVAVGYGVTKLPETLSQAIADPYKFADFSGEIAGGLAVASVVSELRAPKLNFTFEASAESGNTTAATSAADVSSIAPTMIGQEAGPSIVVPQGATGPTPIINKSGITTGFGYTGGSGGLSLSPRVSDLRIMDPTLPKGPSPGYPAGYANYSNAAGQSVNPTTGQTVAKSNVWWHIPLDWLGNE